jgi:hypothetical protein
MASRFMSAGGGIIMRAVVGASLFTGLVCALPSTVQGADNKLPEAALAVLSRATDFELLSLDPGSEERSPKDGFHGYKVLGKTAVKDALVQKRLVKSFAKGMAGDIAPAKCFNPRHGIRATRDGKTVELVICFECSQFDLYDASGEEGKRLLVNQTPEPAFDKVLNDAGLPKAK